MREINKNADIGCTVDLSQPHLTAFWTEHFGVTEALLKEAINAVGNSVDKIEDYIDTLIHYYTHICTLQ